MVKKTKTKQPQGLLVGNYSTTEYHSDGTSTFTINWDQLRDHVREATTVQQPPVATKPKTRKKKQ